MSNKTGRYPNILDRGLTAQAGMVPVVGIMNKQRFYKQLKDTLTLQRSGNATWQFEDIVYLTTGGIIAGADALSCVKTVWSDPVLREIDGWNSIPDDTTLSRIFKECRETDVADLQRMTHQFRNQIWKKLQQLHKRIFWISNINRKI
ncbi:transposase [bacterium]|nr:transposase [bacterium]